MFSFNFKLVKEIHSIEQLMSHFPYNSTEVTARLKKVIEKYPQCSNAYYLLGKNLDAIQYLDKAIEINPKYSDAYFYRALLKKRSSEGNEIYDDLLRAVKYISKSKDIMSFNFSWIYSEIAVYEAKMGNTYKAIEYYTKAINSSPETSEYYFERGCLYLKINDYNKALIDFDKSIHLNPTNKSAYLQRAKIKKYQNDENGYHKDIKLSAQELFEFKDRVEGKKLFEKNIIYIPKYFDWNYKNSLICPNCKSKRIARYSYGLHSPKITVEEKKEIEEGNLIRAGCIIEEGSSPDYICRDCGTQMIVDENLLSNYEVLPNDD